MPMAKRGEHTSEIEKVRQELLLRRQEFETELRRLYKEKTVNDDVQDPADQALSSMMELVSSSLQDSRIDEYNRITHALDMIEEGTYGICTDCQNHIAEKRLKSYPDATRCLVCQEAFEERAREEESE